jgi:hypothetical protein
MHPEDHACHSFPHIPPPLFGATSREEKGESMSEHGVAVSLTFSALLGDPGIMVVMVKVVIW